MLGEKLGEGSGQITGRRVLPSDNGAPKVEISIQQTGKLLGVNVVDMATFVSAVRPDGTLFGDGQGVLMGEGGEMASYSG